MNSSFRYAMTWSGLTALDRLVKPTMSVNRMVTSSWELASSLLMLAGMEMGWLGSCAGCLDTMYSSTCLHGRRERSRSSSALMRQDASLLVHVLFTPVATGRAPYVAES